MNLLAAYSDNTGGVISTNQNYGLVTHRTSKSYKSRNKANITCYSEILDLQFNMPIFEVPCALLPAVAFALNHYPDKCPSRWKLIASFLKSYSDQQPKLQTCSRTKVR